MQTAAPLMGTIRGHRKSIAYLSCALVLASAGTASAATVDPVAHAAPQSAPVAAEHHMPAHADTLRAGVVPIVTQGSTVLAHPATLPAGPRSAARHWTGHHSTGRHWTGRQHQVARRQTGSSHGQSVLGMVRPDRLAPAARRIAPAAERLLPVPTAGPQNFVPISPAQFANAATIVHQALAKRMGVRSAVIAVATAMQESKLLNLSYGTGDSLGLFQQQWDMGWGTPQQIMKPAYAAGKFLEALHSYQASNPAWASQPLYQAAQGVQRSAFPLAYAQWERQAAQLTGSVLHAR